MLPQGRHYTFAVVWLKGDIPQLCQKAGENKLPCCSIHPWFPACTFVGLVSRPSLMVQISFIKWLEVCGVWWEAKEHNMLCQAILISSRLLCEWWPFRKRSTGAVSVSWATAHRSSLVNHDRKTEVREVREGSSMRTNISFLPPHSTTICHASHHRLVLEVQQC